MMSFEEDDEFTLPSRTRKANQHAEDAPAQPIARVFKSKREKLGHRLKRVRIARDLSLRETASKVGVSPTYLSRVENCLDPSPPTEKTLRALADVLGDNFDELMQLAGRVPEDVEKLIKADPDMPVMLRRAREQNVTGAEFLEWLETKKKGSVGVAPKTGPQPTPTTSCGTCGLVSENLKCPQCAGRRNRDHVERTRTAVRAFKAALETMAPDNEYRELRKDLVALTWPGYVQDLEAAVAARLESKGKGR